MAETRISKLHASKPKWFRIFVAAGFGAALIVPPLDGATSICAITGELEASGIPVLQTTGQTPAARPDR